MNAVLTEVGVDATRRADDSHSWDEQGFKVRSSGPTLAVQRQLLAGIRVLALGIRGAPRSCRKHLFLNHGCHDPTAMAMRFPVRGTTSIHIFAGLSQAAGTRRGKMLPDVRGRRNEPEHLPDMDGRVERCFQRGRLLGKTLHFRSGCGSGPCALRLYKPASFCARPCSPPLQLRPPPRSPCPSAIAVVCAHSPQSPSLSRSARDIIVGR